MNKKVIKNKKNKLRIGILVFSSIVILLSIILNWLYYNNELIPFAAKEIIKAKRKTGNELLSPIKNFNIVLIILVLVYFALVSIIIWKTFKKNGTSFSFYKYLYILEFSFIVIILIMLALNPRGYEIKSVVTKPSVKLLWYSFALQFINIILVLYSKNTISYMTKDPLISSQQKKEIKKEINLNI